MEGVRNRESLGSPTGTIIDEIFQATRRSNHNIDAFPQEFGLRTHNVPGSELF